MTQKEGIEYDVFAYTRQAVAKRTRRATEKLRDFSRKEEVRAAEAVVLAPALWVGSMGYFAGRVAMEAAKPLTNRVKEAVETARLIIAEAPTAVGAEPDLTHRNLGHIATEGDVWPPTR